MVKRWEPGTSEPVLKTRVFDINRRLSVSPRTGKECEFYLIDTPDWINVVPITDDGELVCIEQFRHGPDEITLEIPGGMMDPEDGSPEEAAWREFREETGYTARTMRSVGWIHPNPALQATRCHTFVAEGARPHGPQEFDGSEDIDLRHVPLADVPRLATDGTITHALVVVALAFAFGLQPPSVPGGES